MFGEKCEVCHEEFRNTELTYRFKGQLMCKECFDLHIDAEAAEKLWLY